MKGVEKRPLKKDVKWATKYFIRSKWQFIYWKQNLHKWAYWIIPENLDWYETTSDIPTFDLDENICLPEMLIYFFKKNDYYKTLEWIAKWVGSKRIHPAQIYELEIILPSIAKQKEILNISLLKEKNINKLLNINLENQNYITQLKQSILQEAIEWKLTKSWREENKNIEPASVLLEKIKAEKEELIKQKKLKKQKDLKEIEKSEIPFDIPECWENIKIWNICELLWWYAFKSWDYVEKSNNQIIRLWNVKNNKILLSASPKYIPDNIANEALNYQIKKWDILITMTWTRRKRDYCYTVLVWEVDKKLFLNQRVWCFRFYKWLYKKYLNYFFKTNVFLDPIFETETGWVNQGNIWSISLKNIILPLPPLEEQKEIVKKVDKLMKLCDELEKQTWEIKENSENLMKAVLGEVFEK